MSKATERQGWSRMIGPRLKSIFSLATCAACLSLGAAVAPENSKTTTTPNAAKTVELLHASANQARPIGTNGRKVVWMVVTAYCGCPKCCGTGARGLTASGRSISYNSGHFVAADTKLFKFNTQLQIPGYDNGQPVEVIDRGGAIKGYHIDVFFPTHEQARAWGKKWLAVTVLD